MFTQTHQSPQKVPAYLWETLVIFGALSVVDFIIGNSASGIAAGALTVALVLIMVRPILSVLKALGRALAVFGGPLTRFFGCILLAVFWLDNVYALTIVTLVIADPAHALMVYVVTLSHLIYRQSIRDMSYSPALPLPRYSFLLTLTPIGALLFLL